jgi:pyridoxal phosphate enzyme (YggS family)
MTTELQRLRDNVEAVRDRITAAAGRAGRDPAEVTLVAVTKRTPPELLWPLVECGVRDLGENYPQELWKKVDMLAGAPAPVAWHLIGHLQSNKARKTLPMVRLVHAVDSLKLLQTLDGLVRELNLPDPPPACLQVNTSGEAAKHGWAPTAIAGDAEGILACRNIPIIGLMTMAPLGSTPETARVSFALLRATRDILRARTGLALEALSMGMSGDFEDAIAEGATLVRIGSALFEGVVP